MTIRKGDRFRVRGGPVYEVISVGAAPGYYSRIEALQYRPIKLRDIASGRRMHRLYYRIMAQIQDHRWKLLDRFPALLRLPAGV